MSNNSNNDYQYDSCISRGICSTSPRISAMQTVLILYFRLFAKYALELNKKALIQDRMREFVLNSLSATVYNSELNEETYISIIKVFKDKLPEIIKTHGEVFPDTNLDEELSKAEELFKETSTVLQGIKYGEKRIVKAQDELPVKIRDLYNIILIIIKSIAINLLDLESFKQNNIKGFSTIIDLLNTINITDYNEKSLIKSISNAVQVDVELMNDLRFVQEKRYGAQTKTVVSFSTKPGKAVLVVGSNIKELENILEELKGKNIDIYTHDEMMLAHTFPKLKEYPNLIGQYGQGMENCLLDFSTFPGPIILTKHSLHNIENFYKGLLFTTDYTCPKGVIRILNQDYSEVINSANTSRGFRTGKSCEDIEIGFDFQKTVELILEQIDSKKYKKIVFIGLDNFSIEQKNYFYKLTKSLPKDVLIISFSYDYERENLIYVNACYDSHSVIRVFETIKKCGLPMTIFIPNCDRNSVSHMIYLAKEDNVKIFVGKCFPILLNPSLMGTLQDIFSIKSLSVVKNDVSEILKET